MSKINLNEIMAQRAEATGAAEGRIPFDFNGETFSFRDPIALDDDAREELEKLSEDSNGDDLADFWMGEDEYDRFCEAGGNAMMFMLVMQDNARRTSGVDANGRPFGSNRSSRRAAARKQRKQH